MTLDQRLKALKQSLELVSGLHRETEISVGKLSDAMTRLSGNQSKLEESRAKPEESHARREESQAKTEKMLRGFGRFAMAIARDREKRLFDLESPAT